MIQVLTNAIAEAAAYVLVAVGFGLIYSTSRFFHFAHGAIYTLGAYAAYTVSVSLGLGWWIGLTCGVSLAAIAGAIMDVGVYQQMRRAKANSMILFVASLGLLVLLQNLISLIYGDGSLVLRRQSADRVYVILSASVTQAQIERVFVAVLMSVALWAFLKLTVWGRQIRATANDPELAETVGVRIDRIALAVFTVGSALAGLAAVLFAQDTDLRPTMGVHVLLLAVVCIVIGGVDSVLGMAVGALLVALLRNLAVWLFPAQWGDAITFALMILFLLGRPRGFLGKPIRKVTV